MQSLTKVTELLNFLIAQDPKILFNVLNKLPKMGVGRKVTRVTWNIQDTNHQVRPAYWTITKVIPNEDMRSGKVWGTFCHRGRPGIKLRSVRSIERKQWLLLPKDFDSKMLHEDKNDTDAIDEQMQSMSDV